MKIGCPRCKENEVMVAVIEEIISLAVCSAEDLTFGDLDEVDRREISFLYRCTKCGYEGDKEDFIVK